MWYVYMLKCRDGAIYSGVTDNVDRRFKEHASGKGGHYTSYNRPKELLYKEPFESRIDAEQREQQIKRWSRAKKLALAKGHKEKLRNLSISRDQSVAKLVPWGQIWAPASVGALFLRRSEEGQAGWFHYLSLCGKIYRKSHG